MFSLFRGHTPAIRSNTNRSIATLTAVRLGGVDQWMTIRGCDRENPILLFVHGGPGMSDMGAIRHFLPTLEEHFVVVHWSQRGAGKSYSRDIPAESMTMPQFVVDLEELARYLLQRFGHRKLFLVGQSYGTIHCMRAIVRAPELFHAYVGVNQVVDRGKEELISYHGVLAIARKQGNRKAVAQLEAMGEPVSGLFPTLAETYIHKTWLRKLCLTYDPKRMNEFGMAVSLSPELTPKDIINLLGRVPWNMELLWRDGCRTNLFQEIPAVSVPVYFVAGKYDLNTNAGLEKEYLDQLQAPKKEYILFEHSGHLACYEEPARFSELMLKVLRENCPTRMVSSSSAPDLEAVAYR